MDFRMKQRIADWHGEQAAEAYWRWERSSHERDLRDFHRHLSIADKLWRKA